MSTSNENSSAMLIHLSSFANYIIPFGSLLVPVILWQTTKKDSNYIDHHGKEAVNFNLSFFLYTIISIIVLLGSILSTVFSTISAGNSDSPEEIAGILFSAGGFISVIVILSLLGIIKIVLIIIASIRANQGELYRYPLTIRFIK
jgi:uncharacterized Tic20 family protein